MKLFARHEVWWAEEVRPQEPDALLLQLTGWVLACPCVCHDIHNSLKWAVAADMAEGPLKDLHIVLATLQNSFSLLV